MTSQKAALELEAYGKQSVDTLKKGLESDNLEVRFRAAEALAYLDQDCAAPVLAEAARTEPAFRVFALGCLAAMNSYASEEQLLKLLEVPSAETRYGAFRALSTMKTSNPQISGEVLGDQFSYHVLHVGGEPMVHVTRNRRPEVVLFGRNPVMPRPVPTRCRKQHPGNRPRQLRNHRQPIRGRRGRSTQDRIEQRRPDDPGDRRTRRNLPGRRASIAGSEGVRCIAGPFRSRGDSTSRTPLRS